MLQAYELQDLAGFMKAKGLAKACGCVCVPACAVWVAIVCCMHASCAEHREEGALSEEVLRREQGQTAPEPMQNRGQCWWEVGGEEERLASSGEGRKGMGRFEKSSQGLEAHYALTKNMNAIDLSQSISRMPKAFAGECSVASRQLPVPSLLAQWPRQVRDGCQELFCLVSGWQNR